MMGIGRIRLWRDLLLSLHIHPSSLSEQRVHNCARGIRNVKSTLPLQVHSLGPWVMILQPSAAISDRSVDSLWLFLPFNSSSPIRSVEFFSIRLRLVWFDANYPILLDMNLDVNYEFETMGMNRVKINEKLDHLEDMYVCTSINPLEREFLICLQTNFNVYYGILHRW